MTAPGRLAFVGRSVRILRLAAAVAVILALAAVVLIVKGDPAGRSQVLITAAVFLGGAALLGLALVAWPFKKEKNDPRP